MKEKKYTLQLTEDDTAVLGQIMDVALRQTGSQFVDAIYAMRLQIREQIPKSQPAESGSFVDLAKRQ
jgi:hypothetical protein